MNEPWKTVGHSRVKAVWERQLAAGSLSHAYLLRGPRGLGKHTLAREFASRLLGSTALGSHPDFVELAQTDDETVSAEAARAFLERITLKPFTSKYVVGVVPDLDTLNRFVVNSLLKTLEEPPAHVVLLLTAAGSVLPTVVSRCETFALMPMSDGELTEVLHAAGKKASAEQLLLSGGLPGTLLSLVTSKEAAAEAEENRQLFSTLTTQQAGQRLAYLQELAGREESELRELTRQWLSLASRSVGTHPGATRHLSALLNFDRALSSQVSTKFAVQSLLMGL